MPTSNSRSTVCWPTSRKQNVTRFPYEIARLAEVGAAACMVTMPSAQDRPDEKVNASSRSSSWASATRPPSTACACCVCVETWERPWATAPRGARRGVSLRRGVVIGRQKRTTRDSPRLWPRGQAVGPRQSQGARRQKRRLVTVSHGREPGQRCHESGVLRWMQSAHRPRRRRGGPVPRRAAAPDPEVTVYLICAAGHLLTSGPSQGVVAGELVDRGTYRPLSSQPRSSRARLKDDCMDWEADSDRKRVSAAEALGCVSSGDRVVFAHACGDPLDLVDALVARAPELRNVDGGAVVRHGQGQPGQPPIHKKSSISQLTVHRRLDPRRREVSRCDCVRVLPRDPQVALRRVPATRRSAYRRSCGRPDAHGFFRLASRWTTRSRLRRWRDSSRRKSTPSAAHAQLFVHPCLRHRLHRARASRRS